MIVDPASYTINFNLEITSGCGYNCQGCTVDKNSNNPGIDPGLAELLPLIKDIKDNGWRTQELKVGPTDLTTATNGFTILNDPLFAEVVSHFNLLSINLAMLNDNGLQELANKLEELIPGKYLMVGTPVTLKNMTNKKYMGQLRKRFQAFKDMFKTITFTRIYMTVNVDAESLDQFSDDTFTALENTDLTENDLIEFVFTDVRRGFDNILDTEKFKRTTKVFADFILDREKRIVDSQVFARLVPRPEEGFEFTYNSGELYSTITMVETLTVFKDKFKLPKPWSLKALTEFREKQYAEGLITQMEHPECGDCCYIDNCVRNNIHLLMEEVNADKCLFDVKNRWEPACHKMYRVGKIA